MQCFPCLHFAHSCIKHRPPTLALWKQIHAGFLSAFHPRGGKMRLYGLLGGGKYISVQSMWQTRGVRGHAPLGNFVFWPFSRCNLVESGTSLYTSIIHHLLCHYKGLNRFTCKIEYPRGASQSQGGGGGEANDPPHPSERNPNMLHETTYTSIRVQFWWQHRIA